MKIVDPIRSKKDIDTIKLILREKGEIRDLLLFQLGIVTALRASDLIKIKVKDIINKDNYLKKMIEIKETKTGKINRTSPTPKLKKVWCEYTLKYPHIVQNEDNYIFFRKKITNKGTQGDNHITVKQAGRIVKKICSLINLEGRYASHTLRKTYGYHAYINKCNIEYIQKKLNHSNLGITLSYIGITQRDIDKMNLNLDL